MNISVVQSMINEIDKPAIFLNAQYTILAANDAYLQTYTKDVVVGESRCFEISHNRKTPCHQHGETCSIQQCIMSNRSNSVVHMHNMGKNKAFFDILTRPIKDEDGMTTGFLKILDKINFASSEPTSDKMIGISAPFTALLANINRAAKSEITVLLSGETGTGKELVANALHESSRRAEKPFVVIECTGLNENLFESELFGHEKGAFTGATHAKKGLIEMANGGTVFFDEVADIPLSMQVKLLRLIETQCYKTVGGVKQRKADFRLVCATHKNLLEMVERGEFRKDLYYRIAGFPISLPSLAERAPDIPLLANHFLQSSDVQGKSFSKSALKKLSEYSFPGNIRELKSTVQQAALLANDDVIDVHDLPAQIFTESSSLDLPPQSNDIVSLEEAEKRYLTMLCNNKTLSIEALAKTLEVSTRTLYRKLQKHGLKYD